MRGKRIAVGVLVVGALLLGGLVAGGLRERAARAQSGVFATYLAASVEVREDFGNFAVLDTDTRRVIFYNMSPPNYELQPAAGRMLDRDFQRRTR